MNIDDYAKQLEDNMNKEMLRIINDALAEEGLEMNIDGNVVEKSSGFLENIDDAVSKKTDSFIEKIQGLEDKLDNKMTSMKAEMNPTTAVAAEAAGSLIALGLVVCFILLIVVWMKKLFKKVKS